MSTDSAIIGISCLFPGAATPAAFWENLCAERDSTSLLDATQLGVDPRRYFHPEQGRPDTMYWLRGGYVRDEPISPAGHEGSAVPLARQDHLEAWALEVSRAALADSGYLARGDVLARCGLILGNLSFPTVSSQRYYSTLYADVVEAALREALGRPDLALPRLAAPSTVQTDASLVDNNPVALVAGTLGLGGAHFALDAACASSLYAVDLACRYLATGKADLMLAGAVNAADPCFLTMGFSCFQAFPHGGESIPLDRTSRGLIAGEGAGALVLKRYDEALRDGDHIYARIRGIGLSNDGHGSHLLRPNAAGQLLAFERAYHAAGIDPASVAYIECHATGTPTGDAVELQSMETFFGGQAAVPRIGSVKANIGHLLTVAGMAGILKVLLALQHQLIPATIHISDPLSSPHGAFGAAQIVQAATPWPREVRPRRGAISAFGFGGANAHLILEEPDAIPGEPVIPLAVAPLAIIGMEAYFGGSRNLQEFCQMSCSGTPQFTELPPTRWMGVEAWPSVLAAAGLPEGRAPAGAYIDAFEQDFLRSRISPHPTDQPIPQQLLLLQVADRALQDAGLARGGRVAVLVAMGTDPTLHQARGRTDLAWQIPQALATAGIALSEQERAALVAGAQRSLGLPGQVQYYTSCIGNVMASRVAALWDFTGPACTISAGDLSVFRALDVAQMLLDAHEVDAVLLGAVDLAGSLESVLARNRLTPVGAELGRLGFDGRSDGWTVGEGAGAVVLTRLERAQETGSRIYATVQAVSLVTQHPAGSDTADAVEQSSRQALHAAGITSPEVGYLEVLGSGARATDSAEIAALVRAYGGGADPHRCALGSATAVIGHTQAAAGMAGLLRAALALDGRVIPATPGWTGPLAPEQWEGGPFYVAPEARPWFLPPGASCRYATIAARGLDGSAAHVVLAGAPAGQTSLRMPPAEHPAHLVPLAADSPAGLVERLDALDAALAAGENPATLADRARASAQDRRDARFALVLLGRDRAELHAELRRARIGVSEAIATGRDWTTPLGSYFTPRPLAGRGAVAFVYPGSTSAYLGLGRELFRLCPALHHRLERVVPDAGAAWGDRRLFPRSLQALDAAALAAEQTRLTADVFTMVTAATAHAYLSTALLREGFGVHPSIAFGSSIGEAMMLRALGVWPAQFASNAARWEAARLSERLTGAKEVVRAFWGGRSSVAGDGWQTHALLAGPDRVAEALQEEPDVFLTLINTPEEVCIAGDPAACARVIARLGCSHTVAPFNYLFHCPPAQSAYADLLEVHRNPTMEVPGITFYTGASEAPLVLDEDEVAQAIALVICRTVDFPRLVQRAYAEGARIFVEPGPAGACSRWIHQSLGEQEHVTVPLDVRGVEGGIALFRGLARLISHRVPVDLAVLSASGGGSGATDPVRSLVRTITLGGIPLTQTLAAVLPQLGRSGAADAASGPSTVAPTPLPPAVLPAAQQHAVLFDACDRNRPASAMPLQPNGRSGAPSSGSAGAPPADPVYGYVPSTSGSANQRAISYAAPAREVAGPPLLDGPSPASRAHLALLQTRGELLAQTRFLIEQQLDLMRRWQQPAPAVLAPLAVAEMPAVPTYPQPIWNQEDLLEFAQGSIARVFGDAYAPIDKYQRRVRLPMPPYLLVSRVLRVDGALGEFRPSCIVTEYDIPRGAWYAVDEQPPQAIVVESGQCDLLLISYLGIDLEHRGARVYRLLDATMTYYGDLPREGQTLHYEIAIDSFARSGDTLLFFFRYDCFVDGRLLLRLEKGCAGFFSDAELADGRGVVSTARDRTVLEPDRLWTHTPFLSCARTHFDRVHLCALSAGDLAGCFGAAYDSCGRNRSLRLPPPAILMLDRVCSIDLHGGAWGLGAVVAEKDLRPDDWYFACHFKDDAVLAGSLMAEGCAQLLQFFLLYLGLQTRTRQARFQPIPDLAQTVQCRGQVTPRDTRLTYRMEIVEIGLEPAPYAVATVDILVDNRIVVRFERLGLRLVDEVPADTAQTGDRDLPGTVAAPPLFTVRQIEQFARGSIVACFGDDFAALENRQVTRTPNGDLQLISRVLTAQGTRKQLAPGSSLVTAYDVPLDPWYFQERGAPGIPYALLMEIGLQPCGFLSGYLGTPLVHTQEEYYFRNLDGQGTILASPELRGKTVENRVALRTSTALSGVIVQSFTFALSCEGQDFYAGEATFGYFTRTSLAAQVGLDAGKATMTWLAAHPDAARVVLYAAATGWQCASRDLILPPLRRGRRLDLLDEVAIVAGGGRAGLGYAQATRRMRPDDWFFAAHFYRDPVMPGSLGVEALLEAMLACVQALHLKRSSRIPRVSHLPHSRTVWKYRGQIVPGDPELAIEVHLLSVVHGSGWIDVTGAGSLWRGDLRIYEVQGLALRLWEGERC